MMWTTRQRSDYPGEIAGIRLGEGRPVVLIHGVGLNADSWGAQLEPIAERFSVHALDLPGHGESPAMAGDFQIADLSDVLARAIGSLGEPVRLAGHSVGALIAMDIAVCYPGLVCCVAALNAIHRRTADAAKAVQERAAAMSPDQSNDPTPTLQRWFGNDLTGEPAQACASWLKNVNPAAYKATYQAFAEADSPSAGALVALSCPALFLTGETEPNSTPAMSEAMAALVPDSRVRIVEGAAHMAIMTHAAEVNAALLDLFGAKR